MAATLETYDMQMADYSGDLDIQMQPSSSDQWFQDPESKMEEDGPPLFKDDLNSQFKSEVYTHEKADTTIEVDMEPFSDQHHAEYDMVDDEEYQETGTEIHDVELYDASYAHSPAMVAVDSTQGEPSAFLTPFTPSNSDPILNSDFVPVPNLEPSPAQTPALSVGDEASIYHDNSSAISRSDDNAEADITRFETHEEAESKAGFSEPGTVQEPALPTLNESEVEYNNFEDEQAAATAEETSESPEKTYPTSLEASHRSEPEHAQSVDVNDTQSPAYIRVEDSSSKEVDESHPEEHSADENSHHDLGQTDSYEVGENNHISADDGGSVGDPHEISDGVYIDPPPPVLLSMGSEDRFDFSFFNEAEHAPSAEGDRKENGNHHVLLAHLPTLYYEQISAVFEALRQEEIIRNTFNLAEAELILDAVDLQLILTEDNIYAREVTLHDLNVLHDVSGIEGSLRIKLYTSTVPRFISRYQHLQEGVSRLLLEPPAGEYPVEVGVEADAVHDNETDEQTSYNTELQLQGDDNEEVSADDANQQSEDNQGPQVPSQEFNAVSEEPALSAPESNLQDSNPEENNDASDSQSDPKEFAASVTHEDTTSGTPTHHSTPSHHAHDLDEHSSPGADDHVISLETIEAVRRDDSQHADNDDYQHQDDQQNEEQFKFDDYEDEAGFEPPASEPQDEAEQLEEYDEKHEIPEPTTDATEKVDHSVIPDTTEDVAYEPDYVVDPDANYEVDQSEKSIDSGPSLKQTIDVVQDYTLTDKTEEDPFVPQNSGPQTDIVGFLEETWEDGDLDGEGDLDATWDDDNENTYSNSNESSVTLSSKASKRSFDEFEEDYGVDEDEDGLYRTPPSSPGAKRSRTQ